MEAKWQATWMITCSSEGLLATRIQRECPSGQPLILRIDFVQQNPTGLSLGEHSSVDD